MEMFAVNLKVSLQIRLISPSTMGMIGQRNSTQREKRSSSKAQRIFCTYPLDEQPGRLNFLDYTFLTF